MLTIQGAFSLELDDLDLRKTFVRLEREESRGDQREVEGNHH